MTDTPILDMKCILELLDAGPSGICELQAKMAEDFSLALTNKEGKDGFEQIFDCQLMNEICMDLPADENFRPQEESLVAVETSDGWQRGRVVSEVDENTYRVALFDLCYVQTTPRRKLKTLPLQFRTIPQLGVRAIINDCLDPVEAKVIKPGVRFKFRPTGHKGEAISFELTSLNTYEDVSFEGTVVPWLPNCKEIGLKCIKLINKSKVQILSYCGQHDIYVCPMDDENVELRQQVCHEVASYCLEAPDMPCLPDPGEVVASRFTSDDIYYRAQVLTCEEDCVQVSYLDYGNIEYVTLDRLKPLTDYFKQIPRTAIRVSLKGVMHGPLTERAITFIDLIILADAQLTVTFTGSYLDGVTLVSVESNENFNRSLNECLTPYWKLALAAGTSLTGDEVFYAGDADFITLPTSTPFRLFVSHKETSLKLFGCDADSHVSSFVLKTLPKEIAAYCDALSNDCYTPRINELCLAMWDSEWLRALCLHVNQGGCVVYFIDWGNTEILTLNFVRRMSKDFLVFPTIANVCFIHGLPQNLTDDLQNRLDELIPLYSSHMVSVISKNEDEFYLDLPDVIATLTKEGYL